jgi:hypothetical protein
VEATTQGLPATQSGSLQSPMSKMYDLFSDEEKKQLSYLGSMLSRPNTPFEEEVQRVIDAALPAKENQIQEEDTTSWDD